MDLDLPVILGTVREGRRSEHVARYVHSRLAARPGVTSTFIDPRDWPFGNLEVRVVELPELGGPAPADPIAPKTEEFIHAMHKADGFVIVTPEYNYGMPGALKNLLDVTFKPWNKKPFGLVGCGGVSGGLRAIDMLRQVVAGLGAVTVPAHVPVPGVEKAFGPNGPTADHEAWEKRVDKFLGEVEWYARALKLARAQA